MTGTTPEPDPIVPGKGEEHRSAGDSLRGIAPAALRASLYLGLTYLALFVGVGTCQGECSTGYIYHGHCLNADIAFTCFTDDPNCNSSACNYGMFQQSCWDHGSVPDDIHCTCNEPTPPADTFSLSDSIICAGTGSDGWCNGSADLVLSFSDSRGDGVTGINGTIGGTGFSCGPLAAGQSCVQHLPEGQGSINYSGSCTGGHTASGSDAWKLDLTPPVITPILTDGTPGNNGWYRGGPVHLSCSATDALSGLFDLAYGNRTATGEGSTLLSCAARDVAGNTAFSSTNVPIDSGAPSAAIAFSDSPAASGWYTKPITVSLLASDSVSGIHSAAIRVNGGGWAASRTLGDGVYTIDGLAEDYAGNTTLTSGTAQVDSTPPTASWICNGAPCGGGWYPGPVTISLNAADATSGLASALVSANGSPWSGSASLTDGVTVVQGRAVDNAGNVATLSQIVHIDGMAPSLTLLCNGSPCGGGWYREPVALSLGAADAASGVASAQISLDGGATWVAELTVTDGTYSVQGRASDAAGNIATTSGTVQIDSIPPAVQWLCNGQACADGWYPGPVTVALGADDGASGVAAGSLQVSDDGGTTWHASLTLADGTHAVQGRASDAAGNTATVARTVRIDGTAPAITLLCDGSPCGGGWYTGPVAVSLGADDGTGGSGVASAQISLDRGSTWVAAVTLSDGVHDVWGRAGDALGNVATIRDALVRVDTTVPISAWDIADGIWVGGDVPLRGASADATSGVARVEISFDNGVTWTPAGTGSPWTFTWHTAGLVADTAAGGSGYPLLARAWDVAGNVEHTAIVHLRVDNTPPNITLPYPVMGYDPARAQFLSGDAGSGVARARVTFSGNGIVPLTVEYHSPNVVETIRWDGRDGGGQLSPPGAYDVRIEVWDNVGNRAVATGQWVRPDPPTATLKPSPMPTNTPGPRPSPTGTRGPVRGTATGTRASVSAATPTASSTRAPIPIIRLPQLPQGIPAGLLFLPAVAAVFWLAAGGAAFSRDRRGEELRALRRSVEAYLSQSRTNFKGGEDND